MTVGGITGQTFYEKIQGQRKKYPQDEAQAEMAFSNNLKDSGILKEQELSEEQKETEDILAACGASYTNRLHTSMALHESGRIQLSAVIECSAQRLSYEESDYVKVCVLEGYTFKAKVYADRHKVYIEKKTDDGEITGYEVDPLQLSDDTKDPLEQMALESWELARRAFMGDAPFHEIDPKEETEQLLAKNRHSSDIQEESENEKEEPGYGDLTLEQAMKKFYDFVEDRIKNGDPKYQIGGEEMSVREWNRLIEKIDDEIDTAKEQLREEIQKEKEEEQVARLLEDPDEEGVN